MRGNEHDANVIARELEELNQRRQRLDREILDEAREMVAKLDLDDTYGIVLATEGCKYLGVIGHSRLVRPRRGIRPPCRPLSSSESTENGEGSGRSTPPSTCTVRSFSARSMRFGGHVALPGVTGRCRAATSPLSHSASTKSRRKLTGKISSRRSFASISKFQSRMNEGAL